MIRAIVLRGGIGPEHEVSLRSGAAVLDALSKETYIPIDIYVDTKGVWHDRGRPVMPLHALQKCDVVVNALHGTYGEDGEVQKIFSSAGVPHTGSKSFPSFLGMHKVFAKEEAKKVGIKTPPSIFAERECDIEDVAWRASRTLSQPLMVKPVRLGSSVGVYEVVGYLQILETLRALVQKGYEEILIEEKISGREATVGVVDNFRGATCYALPPVEIIPPSSCSFFSHEAKYGGETLEKCPGGFSKEETKVLTESAVKIHNALGLSQYSRSDFIVAPDGVYFLEVNTQPGFTKESLFPKELAAAGISFSGFLDHIIQGAFKNPSRFS